MEEFELLNYLSNKGNPARDIRPFPIGFEPSASAFGTRKGIGAGVVDLLGEFNSFVESGAQIERLSVEVAVFAVVREQLAEGQAVRVTVRESPSDRMQFNISIAPAGMATIGPDDGLSRSFFVDKPSASCFADPPATVLFALPFGGESESCVWMARRPLRPFGLRSRLFQASWRLRKR